MTLNELVNEFEDTMKHTLKISSIATYRCSYECYAKTFFYDGNIQIEDIDNKMTKAWWIFILNAQSRNGKHYAKKTINCYIRTGLSVYLNYAARLGYIKRNPMSSIPKYNCPDSVSITYENFWEVSDFKYFLNFATDELHYNLYFLIFFTGLRIGEAIALTWENIDFYNKKLSINKDIRYVSGKGYIQSSPKTKRSLRTIELSNTCLEILLKMKTKQINNLSYKLNNYIFGETHFLRYSTIRNNFNKCINKAGLKKITLHGLRHSHASMLINAGARDDLIANRLGHSIKTLHDIYSHIYSNRKKDFYPILNKLEKEFRINNFDDLYKEIVYS